MSRDRLLDYDCVRFARDQVLGGSEVHVPSCLAVSPEGTLRFWPSVIYESSSTESNADLQVRPAFRAWNRVQRRNYWKVWFRVGTSTCRPRF